MTRSILCGIIRYNAKERIEMIRPCLGKGFVIFKKDLEEGTIQKKSYKSYTEYWIYRNEPIKTILQLSPSAKKELEKNQPKFLYAIIVTEGKNNQIIEEKDKFYIDGYKITEGEINKYLSKTGR